MSRPSGAARPMLPMRPHGRSPRPALRTRNLRLLSLLTHALASPHGLAVQGADLSALHSQLQRFRTVFRKAKGPSPLDSLALALLTMSDGTPELWIAHQTILVPAGSQAPAAPAAPAAFDLPTL